VGYINIVNIDDFKQAVGKFPTGVCVIATNYQDQLFGFTANSFVSVSLEPALISFYLDKKSYSLQAFYQADYFTVNILSNDQTDISNHFARSLKDKFQGISYQLNEHDTPLLDGSISALECEKYNHMDCGDHVLFVGQVQKVKVDNTKHPLVYYGKKYRELT